MSFASVVLLTLNLQYRCLVVAQGLRVVLMCACAWLVGGGLRSFKPGRASRRGDEACWCVSDGRTDTSIGIRGFRPRSHPNENWIPAENRCLPSSRASCVHVWASNHDLWVRSCIARTHAFCCPSRFIKVNGARTELISGQVAFLSIWYP